MAIMVSQEASDFTLYDSDKKQFTLSQHQGEPVLILFFPLAFTSVCTEELCTVRDNLSIYNNARVKVVAISVDTVHTLAKFKKELNLNFTLLSDFNKEVSRLYSAIYEQFGYGMKGVSKRAAFLIDKNGIVQYAEVLENASLQPNFSEILNAIESLTIT